MTTIDAQSRGALGRAPGRAALTAALVYLVALNLRPALTAVGPMLPRISADQHLSEGVQGLLGALPLLAFALASPVVHLASRRLGAERTVLFALLALTAGIVVRSYAGAPGLWLGTLVAGCAIAAGNVLVPAIVKRDYAAHVSRATSVYSACISVAAGVASAVVVPLSHVGGWHSALSFWALPAVVVALIWAPRARRAPVEVAASTAVDHARVNVWTHPTAWLVTAFMGLQSTTFYVMVTWLPTIEKRAGFSGTATGVHLLVYQLMGVVGGLAIPRLLKRPQGQTPAAVLASAPMPVAVLGLLFAPGAAVAWAVVAGLGTGASLVVALSLISLRSRTHDETTRLSGMAQSLGYLLAAGGPVAAGYLAQATGNWHATLVLMAVLAAVQLSVAVPVGRPRVLGS